MKLSIKGALFFVILSSFSYSSYSQTDDTQDWETYSRTNIAFTNFKMLGVNKNQFAKCVESVNYLDATKRHKLVIIEGVQFADDGNINDLIANDGILTSAVLTNYSIGVPTIPVGEYRKIKNDMLVYDAAFSHFGKNSNSPQTEGWGISCKLKWVKCSSWPVPLQSICRDLSWPFNGGFELTECTISWSE